MNEQNLFETLQRKSTGENLWDAERESITCENPAIPVANVLFRSVSIRESSAAS